jgi:hypothetical protein
MNYFDKSRFSKKNQLISYFSLFVEKMFLDFIKAINFIKILANFGKI